LKPPVVAGGFYSNDVTLTAGVTINTSYHVGPTLVSYNGPAWELDPTEIVARTEPATPGAPAIHAVTTAQFASANVHIPTFQNYLNANNAALAVSFDVTKRDQHDKQQPYNLRVSWSGHQTIKPGTLTTVGSPGVPYDIAWMRFFQADLRRGYALTGSAPLASRRVVATALHDTMAMNVQTAGAPAGSVRIGDDGSVAAIVPAGKAITWDMLANDNAKTSQVKERFWVTFQRGEIRTCANCHPSGSMQFAQSVMSTFKYAAYATLSVTRTGGSTGPVSVNFATSNGSAIAGTDYTAISGALTWADGDTTAKTINVPLLNNPVVAPDKTLSVTLSAPTFGTLGAIPVNTVTLTEPPFPSPRLDVDADGKYNPLTDGALILRYLFGLIDTSNTANVANVTGAGAKRNVPAEIVLFLDSIKPLLDVDGNGQINAQTDGLILLRYLFGLRGSALTNGLIGVGPRPTAQIETYIQSMMP